LSQRELARRLGVGQTVIWSIETRDPPANVTLETVMSFALALGVADELDLLKPSKRN